MKQQFKFDGETFFCQKNQAPVQMLWTKNYFVTKISFKLVTFYNVILICKYNVSVMVEIKKSIVSSKNKLCVVRRYKRKCEILN